MKYIICLFMFSTLFITTLAQSEEEELGWGDSEIFLITRGLSANQTIRYTLTVCGSIWCPDQNHQYWELIDSMSQSHYPHLSLPAASNSTDEWTNWAGFNIPNEMTGVGNYIIDNFANALYRLSNNVTNAVIYLDFRDTRYPGASYTGATGNDIWILFDASTNKYYLNPNGGILTVDSTGWEQYECASNCYYSIWDIKNVGVPTTNSFPQFWQNCLVVIPQKNTSTGVYEPFLSWGPYNGFQPTKYKIYWREGQSGSFGVLDTVQVGTYTYRHSGLAVGDDLISEYKIVACSLQSTSDYSNIAQIGTEGFYKHSETSALASLKRHSLYQNYPNPFNPETNIRFTIPNAGITRLTIYNSLGQAVGVPIDAYLQAGSHSVKFHGSDLPSGMYLYELQSGNYRTARKMILAK